MTKHMLGNKNFFMILQSKFFIFFATGCYTGKIPFAPGTFGTAMGLFPCFFLSVISCHKAIFFLLLFIFFAVIVSHKAEKILNVKDPGSIVIDEISGIMVTMLCIPFNITSCAAGFIIFRFFDIIKPFPIRFLDEKMSGGAGIVMDDLAAGLISNILLRILYPYITQIHVNL